MFNIDRRVYIIRKASGGVYKICCNSGILAICSLSREQTWFEPSLAAIKCTGSFWTEETVLWRDAHPYFSAHIDERDNIHILCRNDSDNLVYIHIKDNMEREITVISCDSTDGIANRYPEVIGAGGKIVLCYMAGKYYDRQLVMHMQKDDGTLTEPQKIDGIAGGGRPFFAVADASLSPYLFYSRKDNENITAGYRKYIEKSDSWSDFNTACCLNEQNELKSVVIDYRNNLYLVRQNGKNGVYDTVCSVKSVNSDSWTDCRIFQGSGFPLDNSSVLAVENRILIYWVKDNLISYCLSIDGGYSWEKPRSYDFKGISPLYCISYKSNNRNEYADAGINLLPGKIADGFRLAFINELYPRPEKLLVEEMKTLLCCLVKKQSHESFIFRQSMDGLGRRLSDVETRLADIETRFGSLEEKLRNEAEKRKADIKKEAAADRKKSDNAPLMPGTGFSNVTDEYLKSLPKK